MKVNFSEWNYCVGKTRPPHNSSDTASFGFYRPFLYIKLRGWLSSPFSGSTHVELCIWSYVHLLMHLWTCQDTWSFPSRKQGWEWTNQNGQPQGSCSACSGASPFDGRWSHRPSSSCLVQSRNREPSWFCVTISSAMVCFRSDDSGGLPRWVSTAAVLWGLILFSEGGHKGAASVAVRLWAVIHWQTSSPPASNKLSTNNAWSVARNGLYFGTATTARANRKQPRHRCFSMSLPMTTLLTNIESDVHPIRLYQKLFSSLVNDVDKGQ